MPRKALITLLAFLLVSALVFFAGSASNADVGAPNLIQADSPCPVTACANGQCHGFDNVPNPDGIHEMTCPETSCASVECHAWETLSSRYHQASDASLNLWIVAPVALVAGLVLVLKKAR